VRRDRAGRGGNDRRGLQSFVRTAGTAREKVAGGDLLRILTAGDDGEDEDEDIGDVEAIDDCDPWQAPAEGGRRDIVEGPLFNLEEKSSCRFSADAGRGIGLCNSWLKVRKAARGSPTPKSGYSRMAQPCPVLRHARRPRRRADAPWPAAARWSAASRYK
jgi:hypothetical protein